MSDTGSHEPILEVSGIRKAYGNVTALRDVSLEIRPGEVVGLVGDNGAGKSTLVSVLSGVTAPSGGTIKVGGRRTSFRSPQAAREAGIETVYQDLALAPNLTISGNLFLGREKKRRGLLGALGVLARREMDRITEQKLSRLNITVRSVQARCNALSGGQRQAVAVARAVAWGSKVVIMDEPTAALGVEEQQQVAELITEVRNQGLGVLLISHNIPQVHERCDRIAVLYQGRLIATLNTSEVSIEDIVMWITGANLHKQQNTDVA